jgi:hypothetical protein
MRNRLIGAEVYHAGLRLSPEAMLVAVEAESGLKEVASKWS